MGAAARIRKAPGRKPGALQSVAFARKKAPHERGFFVRAEGWGLLVAYERQRIDLTAIAHDFEVHVRSR